MYHRDVTEVLGQASIKEQNFNVNVKVLSLTRAVCP